MMPPPSDWSDIFASRMKASSPSAMRGPKRWKKSANGPTTPSRRPTAQLCARSRWIAGSRANSTASIGTSSTSAITRYTVGHGRWSASTSASAPVMISAIR